MRNSLMRLLYARLVMASLILVVFGVSGCGIKAPPIIPGYALPPVVSDLQYQLVDNQINLTWSIPPKRAIDNHTIAGVKVFRLKQALKNRPCQDCPLTFTIIKKIPARSGTMQFQDTIDKGFAYYYKIVLYDAENHNGEDSNIVHLEN